MADYPITIRQGGTFDLTLELTSENGDPIDLTGYSARAQVREGVNSETALISLTSPIVGDEGIDIDVGEGTVRILILAETTAALDFYLGVWDLELFIPAEFEDDHEIVLPVVDGECALKREVTRD